MKITNPHPAHASAQRADVAGLGQGILRPPTAVAACPRESVGAVGVLDAVQGQERAFQACDTTSQAFKDWFRGSQIVDDAGNPRVVYHGTTAPEDFSAFVVGGLLEDPYGGLTRQGSGHDATTYLGSHFAYTPEITNAFAKGLYGNQVRSHGSGGRVYPVYLRVEHPYHATEGSLWDEMLRGNYGNNSVDVELRTGEWDPDDWGIGPGLTAEQAYDANPEFRKVINQGAIDWEESGEEFYPELCSDMARLFRERLIAEGYDGIIYENEVEGGVGIVAFEATQIKSAISNSGEFHPDHPDIRW